MTNNFNVPNEDFVGFSYGQWHCVRDGHIYRTSDGSRYNTELTPTQKNTTIDTPGSDGQYYFNSSHKNRTFTINFAFDSLTELDLRKLRETFNGNEIKELIFDEWPYKAYDAKVTGTPVIKVICFDDIIKPKEIDENGNVIKEEIWGRVYKGEGTIQFTCYNPYAHTPNWVWKKNSTGSYITITADGRLSDSYDEDVYTSKKEWIGPSGLTNSTSINQGDAPTPFIVTGTSNTVTVSGNTIKINGIGTWRWDSRIGVVTNYKNEAIYYSGNACATIPPGAAATCSSGILDYEY